MGLATYHKKRHFDHTREPHGARRAKSVSGPEQDLAFVIQEHAARRLHYDFRLELDGVLLSWAVPKGPSTDVKVKRLAVQTEDHPLEYGSFEGQIPPGQYGAGKVKIWDHGSWVPESEPHEQYRKGHLTFTLKGERLHGRWHLIRRGEGQGEKSSWLLFKGRDEPSSVAPESRALSRVGSKPRGRAAPLPKDFEVERPTRVSAVPTGPDWIHEIKLDGYRIVARVEKGEVRLLSRNGGDWTARAPRVAEAVASLGLESALLDGELVVLRPDGVSEFQLLQNALHSEEQASLSLTLFDLPYLNGRDLRELPLLERKQALEELLGARKTTDILRYSAHVQGDGEAFFEHARRLGLEGVVSKRATSPYRGGRSQAWVKTKSLERQEFVIGGFTEPSGSRAGLGALLVGVWEGKRLRFAGKVGTGFSQASLRELVGTLTPLEVEKPPFANPPRGAQAQDVHWVSPTRVAEVEFTEITSDGKLRHPVFCGLREDKDARHVVRERPSAVAETSSPKASKASQASQASKASIELTHPERVVYPELGLQKQQLFEYYRSVAQFMLPHVSRRPLTTLRCPQGQGGACFFQKHAQKGMPEAIRLVPIEEESGRSDYTYIDDADGLLGLIQMSVLEIHTWGSHVDDLEHPDLMVLDLDPSPELPFSRVVAAAELLHQLFEHLELQSFVKTTGGKGLHVCVPLEPKLSWDEMKALSQALADTLVRHSPHEFLAIASKAKRKGKLFVDYLRNGRGATFIAPYSTRARPKATIATPVTWRELEGLEAERFTMAEVLARLQRPNGDPWREVPKVRQRISRSLQRSLQGAIAKIA
jgi:bifunctional non-homologous end joining protein LigD